MQIERNYEHPELIAKAPMGDKESLMQYSYEQSMALEKPIAYQAKMTHVFINRCFVLDDLFPVYYTGASCLFATLFIWIVFVFSVRKRQSFLLQRLLTGIPAMFGVQQLLYGMHYQRCPWVEVDVASQAYLRMGMVTIVTFTMTMVHAILYVLCRGWTTTHQMVNRNQATNLTMVMGMIYLLYSAYFLSADFVGITEFINIVLALVYFILGIVNHLQLYKQKRRIRQFILQQDDGNLPAALVQAVTLKLSMLKKLNVVLFIFYFSRFVGYTS